MGISHKNEKVVGGIYIADILITSITSLEHTKGLIVEFNGPSHFEIYSKKFLGPTVMKKRHLNSAGYTVKSLPYWNYDITDTMIRKQKVLNDLISV